MSIQVVQQIESRGHEQVVFFNYPKVGLKAIVGIHSTVLGPGLGGCRMRAYATEGEAIDDVLRLSEGMTYKNSLAGLDLGGGKACIIADHRLEGEAREKLMTQFGECLNQLGGRYISAEDMGTSVNDVMTMRKVTKYAAGVAIDQGGGGDPSPWTARGVFNAMHAASELAFNSSDLSKRHVAIQGIGHVGEILVRLLRKAGASVTVCDPNPKAIERVVKEFGAKAVELDAIYDVECDFFAPCAVGQTVNEKTVPRFRCKVIVGAANNQLSHPEIQKQLAERNIIYCPDFVVNAGGVISVGAEYVEGGWSEKWVSKKVRDIEGTTRSVMEKARATAKFSEVVALEIARDRIHTAEARASK